MPDVNMEPAKKAEKASFLTLEEIHRLINSPADTKADIARNIAKYYKKEGSDDGQIQIAEQVFRTLLKDTEVKVRKNLAEAIKNLQGVPYDVVASLARDVEEVSLPILQFSDVLSDVDLIDIISSTENEQQHLAIAQRKIVPEKVSDALINTKNANVVDNLVQNKGADVSEKGLTKIVENHGNSEAVLGSMVERGSLPINVIERLTGTISSELYKKLASNHKGSMEKLEEAVKKVRDVSTMQVMGLKSSEEEFREFMLLMKKLKISEELIPICALCIANLNLFEVSVAKRTRVPILNIRELLKDDSNQGFRAIYGRASLPVHLYEASAMLLSVIRADGKSFASDSSLMLSGKAANRLIEQLLMYAEEEGRPENLEYLLSLIKHTADYNKTK